MTLSNIRRADAARRAAAANAGHKRYLSEQICAHGHRAERYTVNHACCECSALRQRGVEFTPLPINVAKDAAVELGRVRISREAARILGLPVFYTRLT